MSGDDLGMLVRLDAFWDAWVQGVAAGTNEVPFAETVRWLHAADDAPPAPASLVNNIWGRLATKGISPNGEHVEDGAPDIRLDGWTVSERELTAEVDRRNRSWYLLAAAVILAFVIGSRQWMRSDGTGTGSLLVAPTVATPATPSGAGGCLVAPRSMESLRQLAEEGSRLPAPTVMPTAGNFQAPLSAVDGTDSAAIDATLRELVACIRGGEPLRALALVTDDVVRSAARNNASRTSDAFSPDALVSSLVLSAHAIDPATPLANETPVFHYTEALPDGRRQGFVAIEGDQVYGPPALRDVLLDASPDGTFMTYSPSGGDFETAPLFATFRRVGDRWLLDVSPVFEIPSMIAPTAEPPFTSDHLPVSGMPATEAP